MSGKGSKPRPYSVDQQTFDDNWSKIFNNTDPRNTQDQKNEDDEFDFLDKMNVLKQKTQN